jgi:TPP-dependent trihydroxycyclohexane-1,2-dione (THcHDO) dehydratase
MSGVMAGPEPARPGRQASSATRHLPASGRRPEVTTVIHAQTDPLVATPDSDAWWDVPVAEVAGRDSTVAARAGYERSRPPRPVVRRSSRAG